MKILAFAASSSNTSINKQLVQYASTLVSGAEVELLDLNDFEMPLYSIDKEQSGGIPDAAKSFHSKIGAADALLVSFAEHNGSYTAAFKNLFDWTSRIDAKVYQQKPMVMLATSPGARGGSTVLEAAKNSAPHFGGDLVGSLSIPKFHDNFDVELSVLKNDELNIQLKTLLETLAQKIL